MKKMFFALVAVLGMVSCSNDEVLEVNREQIAFGEVFVDNATRADYSSGKTVEGFKVFGTVTALSNTTQIFDGASVTRGSKADGEAWACNVTQYWMPKATYNFTAIVDGEFAKDGEGNYVYTEIPFTVADGDANKDLLYATATVTTDANAIPAVATNVNATTPDGVNGNGVVAFNFSHLLAKMQFDIKNETNQLYKVTNITVEDVAQTSTYTVGGSWAPATGKTELTFGEATVAGGAKVTASETRQILPVAQTLNVTITYNVMDGEDVVGTLSKEGTITKAFEANTVYVVTAALTGTAIDFSLNTVKGWDATDGSISI